MKEKLNTIRKSAQHIKRSNILLSFMLIVLIGLIFGVISKYSDSPGRNNGIFRAVIQYISYITSSLGIWIFFATIIAMYSYKPQYAMMNSTGFFLAMLSGYYLYSRYVCGFYSATIILYWIIFALASSVCAWIVWYGKGNGWVSDILASLPIAVLFVLGFSFYDAVLYTQFAEELLDIIFALVLLILFSIGHTRSKGIRVFVFAIIIASILKIFQIINTIFGGLYNNFPNI